MSLTDAFTVPLLNPDQLKIEIPTSLKEILGANRHLIPKFMNCIMNAVQRSFAHPDTKLKGDIKKSEIQARVNLCYDAITMMYWEEGLSLIQALDILPNVLIDTIKMGRGIVDSAGSHVPGRWSVDAPDIEMVVENDTDLNEE